ncbi:MAG: agmatine deiminase family protein [Thermaurantiacus sp.]|nr:agmatine deiminase family protein [Thermaurantiacus sp.]
MPPEWAPQAAVWTAFPSHPELWGDDLEPARQEVAALVRQLAATVPVKLLAATDEATAAARAAVGPAAEVLPMPFGDVWLRDTGPLFLAHGQAVAFRFNGWGGKYRLAGDDDLAARLAEAAGAGLSRFDLVAEGGALDTDGRGLLLTTEQCLLNPNRNPGLDRADVERVLKAALGIRRVIWLGQGLAGDHTDGHVDNLARFVTPGTVAIPLPADDDPNAEAFLDARARAQTAGLLVLDMPSPGRIERDGAPVPASYMNFVIANGQVVAPLYGVPADAAALSALRRIFPRHRVTGLPSMALLSGGGSFHCITQPQPAEAAR